MGSIAGLRVAVLGAAYRGGVKESAFSGVFGVVDALVSAGATAVVHDPLFTDGELARLGLVAYHFGETVDAAIIQSDHEEYRSLDAGALPGARHIVDGRHLLRGATAGPVDVIGIGTGSRTRGATGSA
jgi:UDP-N-acetyl-D-mannosaminuronate dehydrogenase